VVYTPSDVLYTPGDVLAVLCTHGAVLYTPSDVLDTPSDVLGTLAGCRGVASAVALGGARDRTPPLELGQVLNLFLLLFTLDFSTSS